MTPSTLPRLAAAAAATLGLFASTPAFAQAASTAAAPQQVTRADVTKDIDAQFKTYDANGDGKLTKAELDTVMAKALGTAQAKLRAQMKADFDKIDTNHNAQISLTEWEAQQKLSIDPAKTNARFQQLDANKDGAISAAEYRNDTLSQFDKLDTNHDGIVSAAEGQAGSGGR